MLTKRCCPLFVVRWRTIVNLISDSLEVCPATLMRMRPMSTSSGPLRSMASGAAWITSMLPVVKMSEAFPASLGRPALGCLACLSKTEEIC
jgi:hypothetical protein